MPQFAPLSVPRPAPAPEALTVTAIGSCRVVGPLRKGTADQSEIALNQSGVYGYCHASTEALQQIRVLMGEITIPADLEPLIAPSGLRNQPHSRSDLYFVEISSGKMISTQGYHIQLNYLTRHFEDFFSDRDRTRAFWQHARNEDRPAMLEFLQSQRAFWALKPADRALLSDVRLELATPERLRSDILQITARLPETLFVTHFNAAKHDGTLLRTRADFVKMTSDVLRELRLPCFDPSDYVAAYGPGSALERGNQSLTHYAPEFEAVLYDNWLRRYIRPLQARLAAPQAPPPATPQSAGTKSAPEDIPTGPIPGPTLAYS